MDEHEHEHEHEHEQRPKAPEKYPTEDLVSITISSKGVITLEYKKDKKLSLTPAAVSNYPLKRIPLFNILRSSSPWKPVVEEWLKLFLGWHVEFFVQGNIDPVEEERAWRKNLRLGSSTAMTFGTKGVVVSFFS